jgi:hypothetical protein
MHRSVLLLTSLVATCTGAGFAQLRSSLEKDGLTSFPVESGREEDVAAQGGIAGDCTPSIGPDIIVGSIGGWSTWGTVNGISGYSIGATSCNIGNEIVPWIAQSDQHPVIASNAYRLLNGRFEQIGMSWLKHGWGAATDDLCCTCINPNDFEALGVGCSDPYDSGLNGDQDGFFNNGGLVAGLGPRSEVNPVNGGFAWPYGAQGLNGNVIYKRLQIHMTDLDPALNKDARYFAEVHYIAPSDAVAGNGNNNASFREFQVGEISNGAYALSSVPSAPTTTQHVAAYAWQQVDPSVTIVLPVGADGRFVLAYRCSDNGDGTWHYEYALQNMNSYRAARRFSVSVGQGADIFNLGFHDVDYHSGEPYDGTDWGASIKDGTITWQTQTMDENPNANALRWGTLYNFRFDSSSPPQFSEGSIGLFLPGDDEPLPFLVCGPSAGFNPFDLTGDGQVDAADLAVLLSTWGDCSDCPADFDDNDAVDSEDLAELLANWK